MNSDFPHPDSFHATYFVFLTIHFFIFNGSFYLNYKQVVGNTIVGTLGGGGGGGGQQGGVMSQVLYTEDITMG